MAGVVGAPGVHRGTKLPENRSHIVVTEDEHSVHWHECSHYESAVCRSHDRTAPAFESPYAVIIVHGDDKVVPVGTRIGKVANVADVQWIEATVRQNNALRTSTVHRCTQ